MTAAVAAAQQHLCCCILPAGAGQSPSLQWPPAVGQPPAQTVNYTGWTGPVATQIPDTTGLETDKYSDNFCQDFDIKKCISAVVVICQDDDGCERPDLT